MAALVIALTSDKRALRIVLKAWAKPRHRTGMGLQAWRTNEQADQILKSLPSRGAHYQHRASTLASVSASGESGREGSLSISS